MWFWGGGLSVGCLSGHRVYGRASSVADQHGKGTGEKAFAWEASFCSSLVTGLLLPVEKWVPPGPFEVHKCARHAAMRGNCLGWVLMLGDPLADCGEYHPDILVRNVEQVHQYAGQDVDKDDS